MMPSQLTQGDSGPLANCVCRRCGSAQVRLRTPSAIERLVAPLIGLTFAVCIRCGWTGRYRLGAGRSSARVSTSRRVRVPRPPQPIEVLDLDLSVLDAAEANGAEAPDLPPERRGSE